MSDQEDKRAFEERREEYLKAHKEMDRIDLRASKAMEYRGKLDLGRHQPILVNGLWRVSFNDGDVLRIVKARSMRETWTVSDPERLNRRVLREDRRRGLSDR
jgi:hypothetical protein